MKIAKIVCWVVIGLGIFLKADAETENKNNKWFMTIYGGQMSDNDLKDIMQLETNFVDAEIAAITMGKELWRYQDYLAIETEGQFAYHWDQEFYCKDPACGNPGYDWAPGYSYREPGSFEYQELNAALILRWLKFPWDRYIDTSFALGSGLSYATREPPIEVDYNAKTHGLDYDVSQWLNYLLVEFTLGLPVFPQWHLLVRIHHRSGVYGLISGVTGGSNAVAAGIRYNFGTSR